MVITITINAMMNYFPFWQGWHDLRRGRRIPLWKGTAIGMMVTARSKSMASPLLMLRPSALNRHGCKPVDDMLSVELTRQKSANCKMLQHVVIAVKHLACQNLAFRGATRTKVRFSDPHQTDWLDQIWLDQSFFRLVKPNQSNRIAICGRHLFWWLKMTES